MKNRFDRAAKDIFAEALARMADVSTEVETSPNPQSIDVWSTPRSTPPPELGLLGRMAAQPCLIESYSGTVRLREVRDCLRKQLEWHHELQNKEGADGGTRRRSGSSRLAGPTWRSISASDRPMDGRLGSTD
jgi:hypothetical protein